MLLAIVLDCMPENEATFWPSQYRGGESMATRRKGWSHLVTV